MKHMMPEQHKAMEKSGMKREMKKMKPAMKSMSSGWPVHFNHPGGFKEKRGK